MQKPISKYFKKLSLSEKLLILVIFTLPFERIPTLEATFGSSQFTIKLSLIFGLSLIANLILGWLKNSPQKSIQRIPSNCYRQHPVLLAPILLTLYSLLSYFWVGNKAYWLHANIVQGFVIILFYAVLMTVQGSKNRKQLVDLALKTVLISSGVVIIFGLFQWAGDLGGLSSNLTQIRPEYTAERLGLPRIHSTFLEPLYFGLFLLLPLSILFADRKESVLPKIKLPDIKPLYTRFLFIGIIYLCILLSLARGAIAASALIGLLGFAYNFKVIKQSLNLKDYLNMGLFACLAILSLVLVTGQFGQKGKDEDHDYKKGFSTILEHLKTTKVIGSDQDIQETNSIGERQIAREKAIDVATKTKKNLILGVGPGQYGEQFNPPKGFGETSNFMLLDIILEYGLIGLVIISLFFINLIILLSRAARSSKNNNQRLISTAVVLFILGFILQSISFGEVAITHFWVFLALALASSRPYFIGDKN